MTECTRPDCPYMTHGDVGSYCSAECLNLDDNPDYVPQETTS